MKRCPAGTRYRKGQCLTERQYHKEVLISTMNSQQWEALAFIKGKKYPAKLSDKSRLIESI